MIDAAAWRKLSHLHLHLTDDEAWRIPIDGYPELAAIGEGRAVACWHADQVGRMP